MPSRWQRVSTNTAPSSGRASSSRPNLRRGTAGNFWRASTWSWRRTDQFLCHPEVFAEWAGTRRSLKMEDFYRWQRRRLGYLMDGDEPAGGRWNFDADNRERPPRDGRSWPEPVRSELDELDRSVLAETAWTPAGEPNPMARGQRHAPRRCVACVTPSMRCSPGSVPTRTRCSPRAGTSPTRSCRRT